MAGKRKKHTRRNHGAVTVFLTLILVPCLIFVCAFGDASRVQLSRSQAEAAGDLALYGLMSNYDETLKEWYGLVASVQNIDEFYDVTEQYFCGMMTGGGISGQGSGSIQAYIENLRVGGSVSDFLQVEMADGIKVAAADNASMGQNPALIEDGIVEFMKYRGPVEIVKGFIGRLKSGGGQAILDTLEGVSEDEPITEKKQEFAEAEGEMMEMILGTYLALRTYLDDFENSKGRTNSSPSFKLSSMEDDHYQMTQEKLAEIRSDLEKATELVTKY